MPYFTRFSAGFITALCLSSFAFAAPPVAEDNTEVLLEKLEEKLSDHSADLAKSTARLKRTMEKAQKSAGDDIGDELEVLADVMEEAFALAISLRKLMSIQMTAKLCFVLTARKSQKSNIAQAAIAKTICPFRVLVRA